MKKKNKVKQTLKETNLKYSDHSDSQPVMKMQKKEKKKKKKNIKKKKKKIQRMIGRLIQESF